MRDRECIRGDDKAASRLAPKGDDGRFDLDVSFDDLVGESEQRCWNVQAETAETGAVSGLDMIAARLSPGAISESSSSHLPPSVTS